ncbi:unnamed protein product [Porites lobata]|uniref:PLAT domain-containing protein n=1 Tax=Porites lobata TaxID=104759 RepID=A0ABN8R2V0_9CNID|nr:unnamed protein product [Porites lobata]
MEVTNRGTQLVTLTCDFPVKWIKKFENSLSARCTKHSTLYTTCHSMSSAVNRLRDRNKQEFYRFQPTSQDNIIQGRIMKTLLFASLLMFCGSAHGTVFGSGPVLYKVKIKTDSELGAGTDANVDFLITGLLVRNGAHHVSTTAVKLDNPDHDDFERGNLDSFDVRGIDVGSMLFVSLKQDNAGSHWPWRLDWVEVKKMNADGTVDQEKKFYYEKYLPKYEWVDMSRTSRIKYTWTDATQQDDESGSGE